MALPKDAMGKLAASIVESTATSEQAGLIIVDRSGADIKLNINTQSNTS